MDANYDATGELTEGITVNTINGETQKFEHVQTTALIPVDTACQKVYYSGQVFNWIGVAGYDANGTFVASILDSRDTEQPQEYKEKELEIPEGVFQIRASSYAKGPEPEGVRRVCKAVESGSEGATESEKDGNRDRSTAKCG